MADIGPRADLTTHEVRNQPPERGDADLWGDDRVIHELVDLYGADKDALPDYGRSLGRADMREAGCAANRHPPELRLFDRGGRRLDEVRYHPSYHSFMELSTASGYASIAWEGGEGGHATHAAMVYFASQVEPGHCCPLTMTYAADPVVSAAQGLRDDWHEKLLSRRYDPSVRPIAVKSGATVGMAITEKQGGSDVRANATAAVRDGESWRLTGHKWFCSAPMSDAFLTLAQAPAGLTCFLVPRWLEDRRNGFRIVRLKDKLGNRSNASAEIEYENALAFQIGGEGQGVKTIVEMVHHTRLDTSLAPAGLMRAALVEAHHWVTHRTAFQRKLIDQPLMRTVLADLTLDWEGALALGMRVASAFDGTTEEDRAFARIGVALAKFTTNKHCPLVVCEAMEVLGGMGYVADTPLPMLYREAPLNGIWEGSGNVICLDALRTLTKERLANDVLNAELEAVRGQDRRFDAALDDFCECWPAAPDETEARWFVERLAMLVTASLLIQHSTEAVSDGFVETRLAGRRGRAAGATRRIDAAGILCRLTPGS